MQLWIECPDCKGAAGHYAFHGKLALWRQRWVPCEPCEGKGRVPLARLNGPVDDIEEECSRGGGGDAAPKAHSAFPRLQEAVSSPLH